MDKVKLALRMFNILKNRQLAQVSQNLAVGPTLGGIVYDSGSSWYNNIFSAFKEEMMKELLAAKTPEEKQAIVDKYNNQQSAYAKLRPNFKDLTKTLFDLAVKDYLDLIKNDFAFVNTHGINSGRKSKRYKYIGSNTRITGDTTPNWTSDGRWSGYTQDRTTLGYKGDWDENSDTFRNWNEELRKLGLETFLDKDNAYKLRIIGSNIPPDTPPDLPKDPNEPEEPINPNRPNQPVQPGEPPRKSYLPVQYEPKNQEKYKNFRFPTFPLYNAALLGTANITNKRVLDTILKTPSMRYQAPTLYGKVTDAYTERSDNELALLEYNQNVRQQINNSSDLSARNKAERDLRALELNVKLQNNKAKQDEFNLTSLNLQQITNTNKLNWVNVANQNMLAYVADALRRANAIAQYQAQHGQNLQENIMSNYTDWKSWNRNNLLQSYADWRNQEYAKVQLDLDKAYENWQNSGDISLYQGYKDFWSGIVDKNGKIVDDKGFGTAYANYLGEHGKDTEEARLKFFKNNYQNDNYKNQLGSLLEVWNNYQSDAMNNYAKDVRKIQTKWGSLDLKTKPLNFDGEISSWLYDRLNPKSSYVSIYSMAKGGRFLEYLKHNRKAEKDIRDTTMKSMQESRKLLKRDLDALDRESLLLLRAIFK